MEKSERGTPTGNTNMRAANVKGTGKGRVNRGNTDQGRRGERNTACGRCRRLKERCERDQGEQKCRRCRRLGHHCVRPGQTVQIDNTTSQQQQSIDRNPTSSIATSVIPTPGEAYGDRRPDEVRDDAGALNIRAYGEMTTTTALGGHGRLMRSAKEPHRRLPSVGANILADMTPPARDGAVVARSRLRQLHSFEDATQSQSRDFGRNLDTSDDRLSTLNSASISPGCRRAPTSNSRLADLRSLAAANENPFIRLQHIQHPTAYRSFLTQPMLPLGSATNAPIQTSHNGRSAEGRPGISQDPYQYDYFSNPPVTVEPRVDIGNGQYPQTSLSQRFNPYANSRTTMGPRFGSRYTDFSQYDDHHHHHYHTRGPD